VVHLEVLPEPVDRRFLRGRYVPSSLNQNELGRRWSAGEEGTPMLRVVTDDEGRADLRAALDEIVLEGARRMLAAALEAEGDASIAALADERDECGRRLAVRNGRAEPRTVITAAGPIEVTAPRVNDKRVDDDGERGRFRSSILTPWSALAEGDRGVAVDVLARHVDG
jgi:putative transposase